ncbi:MAG: serine hydrolase domain-containing protein, partial [Bacteroidota bacterium]
MNLKKLAALSTVLLMLFACSEEENNSYSSNPTRVRMQTIADSMRVQIDSLMGITTPGLHFFVQGPKGRFFISSAPNPQGLITENDWFRFASVTKLFTSSAILNMVEEGWLDIDDTITSDIPGYTIPYVPSTPEWDIPNKDLITIRQLLSHTAGVFDCDNDTLQSLGYSLTGYLLQSDPNHTFTTEDFTSFNATNNLSYFAPGTGYHYSNVGYSILGTIISRVFSLKSGSNKTYSDYMDEVVIPSVSSSVGRIRFPDVSTDNRVQSPGCDGLIYKGGNDTTTVTTYNPTILIAQGNGQGTIVGLHDLIRATLKGEGLLGSQSLQLMNTPLSPDYSNEEYTYGNQSFGTLGRGHSGARAGNLVFACYDPATDISMIGYLPVWDISNGLNTLVQNNIFPLFATMELLAEEVK